MLYTCPYCGAYICTTMDGDQLCPNCGLVDKEEIDNKDKSDFITFI